MALYKCLLTYYVPININKKALRELILIVGQLMRLRRAGFFDSTIGPNTSSSAAAERPREPLSQLKSCQLLHICTKNHI